MLTKRTLFGVIATLAVLAGALVILASQTEPAALPQAEVAVTGQDTSAAEGSMEGVVVTAKREGSTILPFRPRAFWIGSNIIVRSGSKTCSVPVRFLRAFPWGGRDCSPVTVSHWPSFAVQGRRPD